MENITVHDMAKRAKKRLRGCPEEPSSRPVAAPEKVRRMLEEGLVLDPLGRLTDHAVFDKLSESERQRYILELAASYRRCLENLQREKRAL